MSSLRAATIAVLATVLAVVVMGVPTGQAGASSSASARATRPITVVALSNRPDLVSGNDVTVLVRKRTGLDLRTLRVTLNGRVVTSRFVADPAGRRRLPRRAPPGRQHDHRHRARVPRPARRHQPPGRGPVFTGPQTRALPLPGRRAVDEASATSRRRTAASTSRPTRLQARPAALRPEEPAGRRRDDDHRPGRRGAVHRAPRGRLPGPRPLHDPRAVAARASRGALGKPQPQCEPQGARHPRRRLRRVVRARRARRSRTTPAPSRRRPRASTPSYVTALGKGFAVISTALDNTGHNCNVAHERRVGDDGQGAASSSGTARSATRSAPAAPAARSPSTPWPTPTPASTRASSPPAPTPTRFTAGAQFADYHLLRLYFEDPSRWGAGRRLVADPVGRRSRDTSRTLNAVVADEGLFKAALNPENDCSGTVDPVAGDPSTRYDSETNPGGVRCSVLDLLVDQLGRASAVGVDARRRRPPATASAASRSPTTGVVYGLDALKRRH